MDDRESPTNDLHLNLEDVLHTDIHEERIKTCLASSPDENENQCNSRKHNTEKNSHNAMGRVEQDSINNNKDSGDPTSCFQENESNRPCKSLKSDMPQKLGPEKKNPRKTKSPSRKVKQDKADITAVSYVEGADGNKTNSNHPLKEPAQTLQFLFSLLQGESKQMDSNVLPLFLHQIAETYFQDGEYEKAMTFIRLEQLYHKQLLANLSSLQQQWETKWKATECSEVPNLKNSSKELSNEELDKLAEFCTSHQEPLVSRSKLINKEIPFRCERFIRLMASEDLKEQITSIWDSDTQNRPSIEAKKKNHHRERDRDESFQSESCCLIKEKERLQLSARKHHLKEELCCTELTLNQPFVLSTETLDTPFSQCLSLRDAGENDSLQRRKEQFSQDGAKIEAAAEKPAATCFSEPMVDALVWTDADYIPPDLIATDENIPSERNLLRTKSCSSSVVIAGSQLESNLNQPQQQQPDYENNRKSVQNQPSDISGNVQFDTEMSKQPRVVYEWIQEETTVLEEKGESEAPEGFFEQFLNGTIKVREGALKFLEAQENSEILPHIPLEQALYSSSEDYSPDESFSSLDELAKRIQIAETVPAEGLVSILKKRDDSEENTLAQIQLRQSKRRVRFQEMEETLEQEDVGAGSCILLILLCVATVFLSIGGTALYCTLGNTESAVCSDFAANVDFYHSQIQKGIEELKHWIPLY
ncbi:consortin isoform X1 [Pantherophis guttatus]|uniref:Consortin isoform X1 n=1 Tax=Pantherophis guttatus TaxID=94885 RepID=A0A6P9CLD9_PANGU|nr:consortin isoform X1 [Pantherophis guttatus]XP_034284094.1 consortin isoform X1 [Pantherophis guttatus]XP_034284097.1 consortin isoform X1 [Pantherophis guttatus]XP_060548376.1 consortin isoform X1 [Pantherophis guttatus]XP_060548377.1 consortin isoform X1 [Pantherophis guttatus]